MDIVVDTSVIIAIILDEPDNASLIAATQHATLFAPLSLPWEVGNALSSGLRRKRVDQKKALAAVEAFAKISVRLIDVPLDRSLTAAAFYGMYAYDAYILVCAQVLSAPLLTIDLQLARIAKSAGVDLVEILT